MLLRLKVLLIAAGLLLVANVWAEGPEVVIVDDEGSGAILLDYGNASAPPPLVIVDGEVVVDTGLTGVPPDCSKAENRPICQSLQLALEVDPCGRPSAILIAPNGQNIYFKCGIIGEPAPAVYVNGGCVANCPAPPK
jgi:hypothetical protein